jgi:hypothetical protein
MLAPSSNPSATNGQATHRPRRLLYRRGVTVDELDGLVEEIGVDRLLQAIDRHVQPQLPLVVAE